MRVDWYINFGVDRLAQPNRYAKIAARSRSDSRPFRRYASAVGNVGSQ
jgi:hypothetical protein